MSNTPTAATVRYWKSEEGWGVLDSDATPGGCWAHFSNIEMDGFAMLEAGQVVEMTWEDLHPHDQDRWRFRAITVRPAQ